MQGCTLNYVHFDWLHVSFDDKRPSKQRCFLYRSIKKLFFTPPAVTSVLQLYFGKHKQSLIMAGDPNEARALALMQEAEKKIKSSTGFLATLTGG